MPKKLTQAEIQARYNQDIIYLTGQGVDVSKITTPAYAHRRAQATRKALAERRPVPSVKQQRGKAQPTVAHLPAAGHTLEQYQIEAKDTATGEITYGNLAHLIKKSPDPKLPYYLLVVSGTVDTLSPLDEEAAEKGLVERTYTYRADKIVLKERLKRANRNDTVYGLFHFLRPDIKWLKIDLVGIAYPK